MAITKEQMIEKFADLLRISSEYREKNPNKVAGLINTRLIGIGYGNTCPRCGGTGHYSYNQIDGTVCYGCGGSGYKAQNLTQKLYKQVEQSVAAGELDAYLQQVAEKQRRDKLIKSAEDRAMKAWKESGISKRYNWTSDHPEDRRLAEVNRIMHDAYDRVYRIGNYLREVVAMENGKRRSISSVFIGTFGVLSRPQIEDLLVAESEKAVQEIEEAAKRIGGPRTAPLTEVEMQGILLRMNDRGARLKVADAIAFAKFLKDKAIAYTSYMGFDPIDIAEYRLAHPDYQDDDRTISFHAKTSN